MLQLIGYNADMNTFIADIDGVITELTFNEIPHNLQPAATDHINNYELSLQARRYNDTKDPAKIEAHCRKVQDEIKSTASLFNMLFGQDYIGGYEFIRSSV